MLTLLKNLAELVKVKTITTFCVLAVFSVLALRGDITPDNVMTVTSTVIAFYFGTQHDPGKRREAIFGSASADRQTSAELQSKG